MTLRLVVMNWRTLLLASWVGVFALPAVWAGGGDADSSGSDRDLEQVRERIRKIQMFLSGMETQKSSLAGQLAEIERQYGELAKTLQNLEAKALQDARHLAAVTKQQQQLSSVILQHNQAIAAQTRAAYAAGRQEWLKLALSQEDAERWSRVLTYYGYLNRARFSQLQTLQEDLEQARRLGVELASGAEQLEKTRSQLRGEQARLEASRRARKAVLVMLERELKDKNLQLQTLQEDENRLQGLVVSLQQVSTDVPVDVPSEARAFSQSQGRLGWPVKGPILAEFGAPRMSGRWDGVLIGAPEGTPVRAVSPGRIAFADWLRGYGLLTIIDHGDGYMSLYAFNQSLLKNVGDWVEAGEAIASVGVSGGQRESGLYFGVREKGRPIDPLVWCKRAN